MQTMYPAMVNSPETVTGAAISSAAVQIAVANGSIFGGAELPLPLTLGKGPSAETVLLTAVNGNTLTVQRGFQGTARSWDAGTPLSRNYTAYDHDAFRANINEAAAAAGTAASAASVAKVMAESAKSTADSLVSLIMAKAGLVSPNFTGTPKAPTAAAGTNSTQIATTAFVRAEIDRALAGF